MSRSNSPSQAKAITEQSPIVSGRGYYVSPRVSDGHSQSLSPVKRAAKSVLSTESSTQLISASTLQHHAASYRFSQADRFPPIKTYGPHCYSGSPTSMSNNGPTMGYGSKIDVINYTNKDAQLFPSPDKYSIKTDFDHIIAKAKNSPVATSPGANKSTDVGGAFYNLKHIPGPGTYNVQKDILSDVTRISMKPRRKMFNEGLGLGSPKCNQYTPNSQLVLSTRFAQPTFGYGQKYDFTKPKNSNPGPGAYTPAHLSFGPTKKDVADKISGVHY